MHSSRTVQLDQLGQIALTVRDLERSTAFYRDTLGLKFLFGAGTMSFFQCGTVRLMLGVSERASEVFVPSSTILYFKVDDLHATYAALAGAGAAFLQPPHLVAKMPGHDLWMAFLKDPDDAAIGLMAEVPNAR